MPFFILTGRRSLRHEQLLRKSLGTRRLGARFASIKDLLRKPGALPSDAYPGAYSFLQASQRDMKAPQDLYRQLLLQPVNVDELSLESASIFLMLGRSFVGYRLVGQQAVSLILEVQQNVVIGFGAHDHLISRREVVVSFSVQMFPKLDQILRGREELGGCLSAGRVDARKDHGPARVFSRVIAGQHGDQTVNMRHAILRPTLARIE